MLRNKMAPILLFPAAVVWGMAVMMGLGIVHSYESRPGTSGRVQSEWPGESRIPFNSACRNLVLFAHPRCPCTRASIEALSRIIERCPSLVSAQVLFFQPAEGKDEWRSNELWRQAAAIPGVRVQGDRDGIEAGRFGAETSGTVFLYDREGRLLFTGGITGGRGQYGNNAGLEAVLAYLSGETGTRLQRHPVFGCSILDMPTETDGGRG